MKKFNILILIILFSLSASAQYNYYKFSAGVGGGVNQSFADVIKHPLGRTISVAADFNINPFVSAGLEFQSGSITGGDKLTDPHLRFFKNNYSALIASGKIELAQVVDFDQSNFLYAIRGTYLGTGIGFVNNNMKDIVRIQPGTGHVFPGVSKSMNLMVPANIGVNFDIADRYGFTRYKVNLNYQFNVTFGEGLDGYNDPPLIFRNNNPDMYSFASVTVKVCFGPEGLY